MHILRDTVCDRIVLDNDKQVIKMSTVSPVQFCCCSQMLHLELVQIYKKSKKLNLILVLIF